MRADDLRSLVKRQPFRPFRIIYSTGDKAEVHHPDLILVGEKSAVVGIVSDPGKVLYDRFFYVDLLHIVGVEDLPIPSNGKPVT